MPFGASGLHGALENERDQLIERVDSLQADQDQRRDHQVKAEMHEELAIKYVLPRARIAPVREPNLVRLEKGQLPGESFVGHWNRKPPPPRK